jgi:hypothetical protein
MPLFTHILYPCMQGMFYRACTFNQPLSAWDTSRVVTLRVRETAVFLSEHACLSSDWLVASLAPAASHSLLVPHSLHCRIPSSLLAPSTKLSDGTPRG